MPTNLPVSGTNSYNGYTFGVMTETLSVNGRPVFDSAGRAVIYVIWQLQIKTKIAAANSNASTDAELETMRTLLTAPGGALNYSDKGFGDLKINVNGQNVKDVMWGPKCLGFNAILKADDKLWEVTWSVEVAIPECSAATYENAIMELCYGVSYTIDRSGYTTRVITGHLQIAQTRLFQADRRLRFDADFYRDKIWPALLYGFRRSGSQFTLSEDKCRLDYSITDEEMPPNYPPKGVINVTASHTIHNSAAQAFGMFTETLEATYEMAKGFSPSDALDYFLDLFSSRQFPAGLVAGNAGVGNAAAAAAGGALAAAVPAPAPQAGGGAQIVNGTIMPVAFSASEPEIYGRSIAKFSMTWTKNLSTIEKFFVDTLWATVPNSDWNLWSANANGALSYRGVAGLKFNPDDDILVDLCQNRTPFVSQPPPRNSRLSSTQRKLRDLFPPPPAASSWVFFRNQLFVDYQSQDIVHAPLPTTPVLTIDPGPPPNDFTTSGWNVPQQINAPKLIIQKRGAPVFVVTMRGEACRANFPIPIPELLRVGGVPVFEIDQKPEQNGQEVVADVGYPIYWAWWERRYQLLSAPSGPIEIPGNPFVPSGVFGTPQGTTNPFGSTVAVGQQPGT